MWEFTANPDSLISDFNSELNKDIISVGSAKADYEKICSQFKIFPCPYIHFIDATCKILNCKIDLSNWRAILLACTAVKSEIKEILCHGIEISKNHVTELCIALEKAGTIHTIKLDYISLEEEEQIDSTIFSPLFSINTAVQYLSLKGNKLDDNFMSTHSKVLAENLNLKFINFSHNKLTDIGVKELFRIIPLNSYLQYLSIKRNNLSGSCLPDLARMITGREISSEDDQIIKLVAKNLVERNKALKDLNKKRKKSGYPECIDLIAPTDRVCKIENDSYLLNRSMVEIDLSYNPFDTQFFSDFIENLKQKEEILKNNKIGPNGLICKLLGLNNECILISKQYLESEQYNLKICTENLPFNENSN